MWWKQLGCQRWQGEHSAVQTMITTKWLVCVWNLVMLLAKKRFFRVLLCMCSAMCSDICCLPSTLSVITNWPCLESIFLPKYPLSNSCGQLDQSYQDYVCPEGYEFMQCDVDPNMEQKASTQANCKLEGSFLCFFFRSFWFTYTSTHRFPSRVRCTTTIFLWA